MFVVQAVNRLIKDLVAERFDETQDLSWFDNKRFTNISLLIQNLQRVRQRKDLTGLQLNKLALWLDDLLRYYSKKITYPEFLERQGNVTPQEINKHIDAIINQLVTLARSVYVEPLVQQLLEEGVNKAIIDDALTIHNLTTIDMIKHYIQLISKQFGTTSLTKEQVFNLILIRIATHIHEESLPMPQVEKIAAQFNSPSKPSSYELTKKLAENIRTFTAQLNEEYPDHTKLFLARDGFVLYEAYITLFSTPANIIYVSRDTLQHYFKTLQDPLNNAITKHGLGNVHVLINELTQQYFLMYERDASFKSFCNSIMQYLAPYLTPKTVFVDSSSRTLPLVLAALSKIMYPNYDFQVYFHTTIYTDPHAGFRTGKENDYFIDMLPDYVAYDQENSGIIPYIQRILPIPLRTGGMKQPQAYMVHLVLQSVLHSRTAG